jgi:hypothetical protein
MTSKEVVGLLLLGCFTDLSCKIAWEFHLKVRLPNYLHAALMVAFVEEIFRHFPNNQLCQ